MTARSGVVLVFTLPAYPYERHVICLIRFISCKCNILALDMKPIIAVVTRYSDIIIRDLKTTRTTWERAWSWVELNVSRNSNEQQAQIG